MRCKIVGNVGDDFDAAALGEAFGVPAGCGRDADFIEQRRMQQMRDGARFRDGVRQQLIDFFQQLIVRIFFEQHGHMHFGDGQQLAEAVVQFARKFSALFVLKLQHAHAQSARAFFHLFPLNQFGAQEAEVNP